MGHQFAKLNHIRIRRSRNKADYVAYVDNVELYRVTPSDVIGSGYLLTSWRLSGEYILSIKSDGNK